MTNTLAILTLNAFINLWLAKSRIEIEKLCKDNETLKEDILTSQLSAPLKAWNNIINELQKDDTFISHIETHLKAGEEVICKICGRTAKEIINHERQKGLHRLTIEDISSIAEGNFI